VNRSFEFPEADWATVGTVGEPGHRTFYLQARQGDDLVTLKLEKQQVAAMAEFLGEILSDLPTPEDAPSDETLDLVDPLDAEWVVGHMQLGYDSDTDRIVVVAQEVDPDVTESEEESDPIPNPDLGAGRIGLTRGQAASIVRRGAELVTSGRPRCALCGNPMDPEGHSCPRTNGHRPPTP
jgi:uncharacterized repeat protein (TIGR03847 family)